MVAGPPLGLPKRPGRRFVAALGSLLHRSARLQVSGRTLHLTRAGTASLRAEATEIDRTEEARSELERSGQELVFLRR